MMEYLPLILAFWFLILATLCAVLYSVPVRVRVATSQQETTQHDVCVWQPPTDISGSRSWESIRSCHAQLRDSFRCPCGKSLGNATAYFSHQDKCWAWGHYDGLTMTRNKLGGCQTKGGRFIYPKNVCKPLRTADKANVCPLPKCPSYGVNGFGYVSMHHELLCGTKWFRGHQDNVVPGSSLEITFDSDGAIRPVTLTDLAELYPKMVKKFRDKIKIT